MLEPVGLADHQPVADPSQGRYVAGLVRRVSSHQEDVDDRLGDQAPHGGGPMCSSRATGRRAPSSRTAKTHADRLEASRRPWHLKGTRGERTHGHMCRPSPSVWAGRRVRERLRSRCLVLTGRAVGFFLRCPSRRFRTLMHASRGSGKRSPSWVVVLADGWVLR